VGAWPAALQRRLSRFFWPDPTVVADAGASPEAFRSAMSALHFGGTIKITGSNRHPLSDALILDNLDVSDAAIVDIGASDGSTSVDLIARLPDFRTYTIADLYLRALTIRIGTHTYFYGPNGQLILVVGRRALAWPTESRFVAALYRPLAKRALKSPERSEVLLLNPETRKLIESDPRITYREHDVFTPWPGQRPDVIKVANLLRRIYFSDDEIRLALSALLRSLAEGGHLLIVDNPRVEGINERAGLYRRTAGRFALVATTDHAPEIADLLATTDEQEQPLR